MGRSLFGVATLATLVLSAAPATLVVAAEGNARAEGPHRGPAEFTPAQRQEAEDRWREGRALYEEGRLDEARLKYAQAFAVLGRTNILWNLSVAEFYAGHPVDALRHFKEFTERADADPADVKRAHDKYIPEAERLSGHIAVEAATGAEITVDDEVQPGAAPLKGPVDVVPGDHRVRARVGTKVEEHTVSCPAGQTITVRFELPAPVLLSPPTYSRGRTLVPLVLGLTAVAAAGVGVAFALDSQAKDDDNRAFADTSRTGGAAGVCVDRASAACRGWQDRLDDQQTSATLGKAFYIGGGVLAAAAVITYVAWPRSKAAAPAVGATPLPGGGAVSFGGAF